MSYICKCSACGKGFNIPMTTIKISELWCKTQKYELCDSCAEKLNKNIDEFIKSLPQK